MHPDRLDRRPIESNLPKTRRGNRRWISAPLAAALAIGAIQPGTSGLLNADEARQSTDIAARVPSLETGREQDHLTGDWSGLRSDWTDRGVHLMAGYSAETFGNASGGIRTGVVYTGLLELGVELDIEKLLGWRGAAANVSALYPHGKGLTENHVGDLATISNIDAYDSFRLFELWLEQSVWEERISLRIGQLAADEEFALSDMSGVFLNGTFGMPAILSLNVPLPEYPAAAPGARLRLHTGTGWYAQAAVYDGHPDPGDAQGHPVNKHGVRVNFNSREGGLSLFEIGFHDHESDHSLRASYRVGGWYHTADFVDLRGDTTGRSLTDPAGTGSPRVHAGNWGVYAGINQPLLRESTEGQGLGVFWRGAAAPNDRNLVSAYMDGGFLYAGPIPGRDEDRLGIGVAWLRMSGAERGRVKDANFFTSSAGAIPDEEIVVELTYDAILRRWWTVQPDVQWIHHPGGSGAIPDAWVFGVRSSVSF